jgi:phospholipid/cholesterol/gamma-HCH transport system substrate-binding protein
VFGRLAREDRQISAAVSRLPSTLRRTESALAAVRDLGEVAGPAFEALRPAVRQIDDANSELRPLGRTAEPIVREQVRPFARAALPYLRNLGPAARDLSRAAPDLKESVGELNRFFNIAAYNPNGAEPLAGDAARDRAREEGFLFHLGWTAHNSNSLFSTSDASGPFRRVLLTATCTTYQQLLLETGPAAPLLRDILGIKDLLADTKLCPP